VKLEADVSETAAERIPTASHPRSTIFDIYRHEYIDSPLTFHSNRFVYDKKGLGEICIEDRVPAVFNMPRFCQGAKSSSLQRQCYEVILFNSIVGSIETDICLNILVGDHCQ
jgi:hypothetical protein